MLVYEVKMKWRYFITWLEFAQAGAREERSREKRVQRVARKSDMHIKG